MIFKVIEFRLFLFSSKSTRSSAGTQKNHSKFSKKSMQSLTGFENRKERVCCLSNSRNASINKWVWHLPSNLEFFNKYPCFIHYTLLNFHEKFMRSLQMRQKIEFLKNWAWHISYRDFVLMKNTLKAPMKEYWIWF